jgi:hypothetical protein
MILKFNFNGYWIESLLIGNYSNTFVIILIHSNFGLKADALVKSVKYRKEKKDWQIYTDQQNEVKIVRSLY